MIMALDSSPKFGKKNDVVYFKLQNLKHFFCFLFIFSISGCSDNQSNALKIPQKTNELSNANLILEKLKKLMKKLKKLMSLRRRLLNLKKSMFLFPMLVYPQILQGYQM